MIVSVAPGEHEAVPVVPVVPVVLSGHLDTHSASGVRAALHTAIDTGSGDLVVDLTGVEVLDASGLGVLVGAHRRAVRRGRGLVLRGASLRLRRILRATGLHRVLTLEPVTGQ